jgi:SAM-dependent methyltransferase
MTGPCPTIECPCDGTHCAAAFSYEAPPAGEIRFDVGTAYRRCYRRCGVCGHWFSRHAMDLSALYGGAYVDATYGEGMRAAYDRIMALPTERSDNAGRVACVLAFAGRRFGAGRRRPRLLDVGSGLAVFPARMREAGWACTALDPDARAAGHAGDVAGVTAVTGDFLTLDAAALGRFDVVSLNKVLEHVEAPVALLRRAAALLDPGGFVYVEVPDGDAAAAEGPEREEFFVEHHHVFSPASLAATVARAGLSLATLERLREPSTKYALRAFCVAAQTR